MSQDQGEEEDLVDCALCGATIARGTDPNYAFSEDGAICLECAIQRGGEYDAPNDHWLVAPDVSDLTPPEEAARP